MLNVTVYTTSTCPFCKMLMSYLAEKNVGFTEKRVDMDKQVEKEMMEASGGFLGVPFTVVDKDPPSPGATGGHSGSRETVIGFDKNRLDQILG